MLQRVIGELKILRPAQLLFVVSCPFTVTSVACQFIASCHLLPLKTTCSLLLCCRSSWHKVIRDTQQPQKGGLNNIETQNKQKKDTKLRRDAKQETNKIAIKPPQCLCVSLLCRIGGVIFCMSVLRGPGLQSLVIFYSSYSSCSSFDYSSFASASTSRNSVYAVSDPDFYCYYTTFRQNK